MTEAANGGLREAMRQMERRQDDADRDRRELWKVQNQLAQTHATNGERVVSLTEDFKDVRAELAWVKRALWAATGTFTVLILSAVGLVLGH